MHNYGKQNKTVHFIIQKIEKSTHFPQKVYKLRKLNSLILTEREETKTKYLAPSLKLKNLLIFTFLFVACFREVQCAVLSLDVTVVVQSRV